MERYQIASARNWRVRKSYFTPGKLGSSSAVGPSTTRVPASKSSRIDWLWPLVVSPAELIGWTLPVPAARAAMAGETWDGAASTSRKAP